MFTMLNVVYDHFLTRKTQFFTLFMLSRTSDNTTSQTIGGTNAWAVPPPQILGGPSPQSPSRSPPLVPFLPWPWWTEFSAPLRVLLRGQFKFSSITDYMRDVLHWLIISQRKQYRFTAMVSRCVLRCAPSYCCDLCCPMSVWAARRVLHSAKSQFIPLLFFFLPFLCSSFSFISIHPAFSFKSTAPSLLK